MFNYTNRKVFRIMRIILLLLVLTILIAFSAENPFITITSSFGANASTQHGFSWSMATSVEKSWIEYCPQNIFVSFENSNVKRVNALSTTSQNNSGKRKFFKVVLEDLKPATLYTYRLVTSDGSISPVGTFKTAEEKSTAYTFLGVTDTQGSNAMDYALWGKTLTSALKRFPEARFLVHTGDIVDQGDSITQWESFIQAAQPMLLHLPIVPVVGNHDTRNINKSNSLVHNFTDHFNTPQLENTGAVQGTVYAFDYGDARIAVMNTQCGTKNLNAQAQWLLQDMKQSDKTWKIVALHRGPYGSTYDSVDIRTSWVTAFDEADIDLVLEGHDHNYMRSFPMKNREVVNTNEGTVYINSNSAGVKFYETKDRTWQAVDIQPHKQMYLAVTVENQSLLTQAFDVNNTLIDAYSLDKPTLQTPKVKPSSAWLLDNTSWPFAFEDKHKQLNIRIALYMFIDSVLR